MFVRNFSRELWAVEKVENPVEIAYDRETHGLQPTVVSLELRNTKMSERSEQPPQFFDFSFHADGSIEVTQPTPPTPKIADALAEILRSSTTGMTAKHLSKVIDDETGKKHLEETLRNAMARDERFTLNKEKRPYLWRLR